METHIYDLIRKTGGHRELIDNINTLQEHSIATIKKRCLQVEDNVKIHSSKLKELPIMMKMLDKMKIDKASMSYIEEVQAVNEKKYISRAQWEL